MAGQRGGRDRVRSRFGLHRLGFRSWLKELGEGVGSGRLKYRETIAQGLAQAPEAFLGLLKGRNFGKQLVKLG